MDASGVTMLALAVASTGAAWWMARSYDRRWAGPLMTVVLPGALFAALAAVLCLHVKFLVTAAGMIPVCLLFFWAACRIPWHGALYLSCLLFMSYDLALLLGGNVIVSGLLGDAVEQYGAVGSTVQVVTGFLVLGAAAWALRRWVLGDAYRLSQGQSLLILVPLVPYFYIRSGIYMMAFNGWVDAPYQGEVILILLSYLPTVVVMVCAKNALNVQILQNEVLAMEQALSKQHQQYLVKRETIDLMNKKYHDMRHFASVMEAGGASLQDRAAFERELGRYGLFVDTGCALVDVILADKIARCGELGIQLVPYVDARRLDFMGSLDVCTLFGNALDNAIAATDGVAEADGRTINVRCTPRGDLMVLRFTNPYVPGTCALERDGDGSVQKGAPNADASDGHGYGMGNMRRVVESYGGDLTYTARDGRFTLCMLVPLPRP